MFKRINSQVTVYRVRGSRAFHHVTRTNIAGGKIVTTDQPDLDFLSRYYYDGKNHVMGWGTTAAEAMRAAERKVRR